MQGNSAPADLHAEIYRYWEQSRGRRRMPGRADFDPAAIRTALPHLLLLDIVDGRFRYRLVGTQVSADIGRDMTGTFAGSHVHPPGYAQAIIDLYERVRRSGRPLFALADYETPAGVIQALSRLLLPLGADGRNVDMILISRAARNPRQDPTAYDWLGHASGRITEITEIGSAAEVEALSAAWERQVARPATTPA